MDTNTATNLTASSTEISAGLTERLRRLRDALSSNLVERDVAVRLVLLAALAGEHLLLLGPPGTAKSLLARRLRRAFRGATYFERLLTKFTVPEEIFGPLSIKGLEADRYERLTKSYLPSVSIAFLDEIFKANSAILNSLLTLLNERLFDNGAERVETPLLAVVGASNELPHGDELDALFDRFLLRLQVGLVSTAAFPSLMALRGDAEFEALPSELTLTPDELRAIQAAAEGVEVPDDVIALLASLRTWCQAEKISVSDRRWRKIRKLLQVSAKTNGRDRVSVWDAWLVQHCIWDKPEQREAVYAWYAERVGASKAMDPSRLTRVVVVLESQLQRDRDGRAQMRDPQGKRLFEGEDGKPTIDPKGRGQRLRNMEPLYLAPADTMIGNQYNGWQVISDRTNKNEGYTVHDLADLHVTPTGRRILFSQWPDQAAYLANRNNWLIEKVDLRPCMEPQRHASAHLRDKVAEIDRIRAEVAAYSKALVAHIASMDREIREHLWVTADFVEPAARALEQTTQTVDTLVRRVDELRKGFEMLPCEVETLGEEEVPESPPKPVPPPKPAAQAPKRK